MVACSICISRRLVRGSASSQQSIRDITFLEIRLGRPRSSIVAWVTPRSQSIRDFRLKCWSSRFVTSRYLRFLWFIAHEFARGKDARDLRLKWSLGRERSTLCIELGASLAWRLLWGKRSRHSWSASRSFVSRAATLIESGLLSIREIANGWWWRCRATFPITQRQARFPFGSSLRFRSTISGRWPCFLPSREGSREGTPHHGSTPFRIILKRFPLRLQTMGLLHCGLSSLGFGLKLALSLSASLAAAKSLLRSRVQGRARITRLSSTRNAVVMWLHTFGWWGGSLLVSTRQTKTTGSILLARGVTFGELLLARPEPLSTLGGG